MDYKSDFNDWFIVFEDGNNREPTLIECEEFRRGWIYQQASMAEACHDYIRYAAHDESGNLCDVRDRR